MYNILCLSCFRAVISPVSKTEMMNHCLVTLQVTAKLLQKCDDVLMRDLQQPIVRHCLKHNYNMAASILKDGKSVYFFISTT